MIYGLARRWVAPLRSVLAVRRKPDTTRSPFLRRLSFRRSTRSRRSLASAVAVLRFGVSMASTYPRIEDFSPPQWLCVDHRPLSASPQSVRRRRRGSPRTRSRLRLRQSNRRDQPSRVPVRRETCVPATPTILRRRRGRPRRARCRQPRRDRRGSSRGRSLEPRHRRGRRRRAPGRGLRRRRQRRDAAFASEP